MLSLVIPVYRNEASLARLLDEIQALSIRLTGGLEVVFVVDGSPDRSAEVLRERLPIWPVRSQLLELSRNFGAFAAISAGLAAGDGEHFAVLAADLQEPPDLILEFQRMLAAGDAEVVLGERRQRDDPASVSLLSRAFWAFYRRYVLPELPPGGVDVFGCTRVVRDELVRLREVNTSLVGLLIWLGFRRAVVPYDRRARTEGRSAWTFGKRWRYALDSIFSFSDLPIRLLLALGMLATAGSVLGAITVFVCWQFGLIPVLGYTPLMLTVMAFGGLTAFGLGIVGEYLWLTLQNSRQRPGFVVRSREAFGGAGASAQPRASLRNSS